MCRECRCDRHLRRPPRPIDECRGAQHGGFNSLGRESNLLLSDVNRHSWLLDEEA